MIFHICTFVVFLSFLSGCAHANDNPKWEFGIALAGQALRDYRGSQESQINAYPVPFFIYRGKVLKADRDGVRSEFLSNRRIEINISGETALNGSSDDNDLREGMPDLESAFELGPSFNINLSGKDFKRGWQLRMPLRAVLTIGDTGVHYRGYTLNPRMTYTEPNLFDRWRGQLDIGALYGSNRYHDYYYKVEEKFATELRPRYEADQGFSGYYFKTSLSRRKQNFLYGASLRYDLLDGAVFEDSPLVETNDYFSLSFFIGWITSQSKD